MHTIALANCDLLIIYSIEINGDAIWSAYLVL
ncbi:uncharacterized protein METZ01_LOCUS464318, partial [marine metagenome]